MADREEPSSPALVEARRTLAAAKGMPAVQAQTALAQSSRSLLAELEEAIEQIKDDLDALSELGEMESLRLQMAIDRMAKMTSTLSNLLKKIADTSQQITQNLK